MASLQWAVAMPLIRVYLVFALLMPNYATTEIYQRFTTRKVLIISLRIGNSIYNDYILTMKTGSRLKMIPTPISREPYIVLK